MKFVDFIAKLFFGEYSSDGFYQEDEDAPKDTYTLSSIFPSAAVEKQILDCDKA